MTNNQTQPLTASVSLRKNSHTMSISFTKEEIEQFEKMYEESGFSNKSRFIAQRIFKRSIQTVRIDVRAMEFQIELSKYYKQFKVVAKHYSSLVQSLKRHPIAPKDLDQLQQHTLEFTQVCKEVIALTKRFEIEYVTRKT